MANIDPSANAFSSGQTTPLMDARQAQEQLLIVNRALKLLSACNEVLIRAHSEQQLLNEICRLIVERGGYHMAWVGMAETDEEKSVHPVAQFGHDAGYLEQARITWADTEQGRGTSGAAIRTGKTQVNQSFLTNPSMAPWRAAAQMNGYQSCISLPLRGVAAAFGVLTIYSSEPYAFNTDEAKLLEELSGNLAYGILHQREHRQRRLIEQELIESEERFRVLVEYAPEAIVVFDVDQNRLVDANANAEKLFECSYGELMKRSPRDFYPDPQPDASRVEQSFRENNERALKGEQPVFERLLRSAKGRERLCEVRLVRLPAGDRKLIRGSFIDITERKKREQELKQSTEAQSALRASTQQLRSILDNLFAYVALLDTDGVVQEVNNVPLERAGARREDVIGRHFQDAPWWSYDEKVRSRLVEAMEAARQGQTRRYDEVVKMSGELVPIDFQLSPIRNEEGRVVGLLPTAVDITERKRVEEELKLSAQLLNNISDSVFLFDLGGEFVYLNEAAWKSRGYTREEMMAMNLRELNTPEFRLLIPPRIKEVLEKGHGIFETAHYCKDGSIMPVEISSRLIESGGRRLLLAAIRDITERKKTEAALKQHKQMLDTSIDGFWVTDMQGILLEANEAYAKISGYTVDELVGMHISQLEAIELSPEVVQEHISTVANQGYDRFETRHRRKDGHVIDIEVAVTHLEEPQRLIVFCKDITLRKQGEAELLKSEANLRAMMDNSPYLTWLKDAEGRYMTINKVFADYLRLDDARQATGKTDLDLQPRELAEKYRADDAEVMASRKQKHVEESSFDGKDTHWVETFKTPIIGADGKVLGTVGFASDITERKNAERAIREAMLELEKKELAKTRFLAAAGHDLRQPLAAANLYLDTLKRTDPTHDQNEVITRLDQVMDTFKVLLDALLNISLLDAGAIKPEYATINVPELIIWLEENYAPVATGKKLGFRLFFPIKETLFVRSDIGLINSVLMNLVSNAIKFTNAGGILVSARRRGSDVLFQVWDTGMGIPEEHIKHIFDEFYQVNNPQRDRTSGLGLGLAIVERALALLGGTIEYRSQSGRGSVFGFRLPLDSTADAGMQPAAHTAFQEVAANNLFARGKRFAIVEDDALVAEAMYKALVVMGGEVECFHNAEDAMLHAAFEHADYYVVDYMLGGTLNGIQLLNQLRQKTGKPIRAVLLTGDTSPAFVRSVANYDWPVLHKPVNLAQLFSALGALGI